MGKEGKTLATIDSKMIGDDKDGDHPIEVVDNLKIANRKKPSLLMVMVSMIAMRLWYM